MPDSTSKRPSVLLLSLATTSYFYELYGPLLDRIAAHAKIERATESDEAIEYLSSNNPRAILVTDPGLTRSEHYKVFKKVLPYVQGGGILIFCLQFSSFIRPADFDRFFRTKLHLPWKFGIYERNDTYLNRSVTHIKNMDRLPRVYSQKAVRLKDVDPGDALYLPSSGGEAPVAFTAYEQGWVGYTGDVNTEEGTYQAIVAMCGF
ncbi:hypothetical protein VTN02DRAFT_4423 [Thermoascus thermophilus]